LEIFLASPKHDPFLRVCCRIDCFVLVLQNWLCSVFVLQNSILFHVFCIVVLSCYYVSGFGFIWFLGYFIFFPLFDSHF
jgi:hypothetical protein